MSLQLTSGSGELTPFEVTFQSNEVVENLSLPSYSYCITGISKPADEVMGQAIRAINAYLRPGQALRAR